MKKIPIALLFAFIFIGSETTTKPLIEVRNDNSSSVSIPEEIYDSVITDGTIIEKLDLKVDIAEAQNTYFNKSYHEVGDYIENIKDFKNESDKEFVEMLLNIGKNLNINTNFYQNKMDKAMLSGM